MKKANRGTIRFVSILLFTLLVIAVAIWALFNNLIGNYEKNTAAESADHLVEINHQIKLYVEEKINSDWQVTHSVANVLETSTLDEKGLLALLQREMDIWDVSDIMVYLEDGRCLSVHGDSKPNDVASEVVYYARLYGEYLSIIQSSITYSVPLHTSLSLDGSSLAAVSVVQNLESFLDHMDFSSFDGSAYMYLTQDNGVVVSKLTHKDAPDTYNVMSIFGGKTLTCLFEGEHAMDDMLVSDHAMAHMMMSNHVNFYVVTTPINAKHTALRLFYFVPEEIVNHTMTSFSSYIMLLCIMVVSVFTIIAVVTFLALYRARKAKFDTQLMARERMFDLLVRNTSTAFGLFSIEQRKPIHISSNIESIIGEEYIVLEKTGGRYHFVSASGSENVGLHKLNDKIEEWDGKTEFISGFIPRDTVSGRRYYSIHLYPNEGNDKEFVGIAQDVTGDREREEALKTALDMADRASAAKTRFLSNMSHDIRTPMNAIVNMTNFALTSVGEPETQRGYLETIRESSEHLLHLINDVLDMSRIESGQAVVISDSFDMHECLRGICEMIRPLAAQRKQRFIADIHRMDFTFLLGDQLKVSQIMINLLNNAVKFTPVGGRVRFSVVEMSSIRDDVASLRFTVEDNGIGIDPDMAPHVFEPFMRGDEKRVSGTEGTGLGLSICKSYVSAMGGTITCQSEPGKGSTFTVEIPFERAGASPEPSPIADKPVVENDSFAGKRALLCEDNMVNQMIAEKILHRLGFAVDKAGNGKEGVKMFEEAPQGYYDVIYMDIQMPVMDGYQATTAIRASSHPDAQSVPVVAMTANVFTEDVEKSRAAGMNGHIGKPISVREVVDVTAKAIKHGG